MSDGKLSDPELFCLKCEDLVRKGYTCQKACLALPAVYDVVSFPP